MRWWNLLRPREIVLYPLLVVGFWSILHHVVLWLLHPVLISVRSGLLHPDSIVVYFGLLRPVLVVFLEWLICLVLTGSSSRILQYRPVVGVQWIWHFIPAVGCRLWLFGGRFAWKSSSYPLFDKGSNRLSQQIFSIFIQVKPSSGVVFTTEIRTRHQSCVMFVAKKLQVIIC